MEPHYKKDELKTTLFEQAMRQLLIGVIIIFILGIGIGIGLTSLIFYLL